MREYKVFFADGSVEVIEAESIDEARELAAERWESPVTKIVAQDEPAVAVAVNEPADDPDEDEIEEEDDEEDEDD